jgi:citrate synthase
MAEIPKLVSSMGKADLDRIFVRGHDLNEELLGKISFAQMVYLMLVGRMPSAEEGRMIDTMLIVLVDHGMTTGALAARLTYHSAPEALQGAVAAAILGAGSVHLGSSEYCAKMLNDALPPIRRT